MDVDKGYLGQVLLKRGFKDWFLYMFRIVSGHAFNVDSLHLKLFEQFQKIFEHKETRLNLNLCPRSSKTTMAKYFVCYCLTYNPRANFIYTSFSQSLLSQISTEIRGILEHPVYKAMYNNCSNQTENIEIDPVNEFWKEYLFKEQGKTKYNGCKIVTSQGGLILFASIGAAITGFGCGIKGMDSFSGALIIDDANKPIDVRSDLMRKKVQIYFSETLFTRLNNSNTPVVNIQQRLHVEDLTGFLVDTYGFKVFKYPLLDKSGKCLLPHQYTPERIAELKKNTYTFSAQYQQEPVIEGGNLIKTDLFKRYTVRPDRFDTLFIVADTAFSEKKSADNSAFGLFGILGKDIYMLDGYCKKVIFPDLRRDLKSFYQKAVQEIKNCTLSAIYIENKGSGISLIQQLREEGLPISELSPTVHNEILKKDQVADKYLRFNEVAADIESGYFHIPESSPWLLEFIYQCASFTGGKQDTHDDYVDVMIYGLKIRRKTEFIDWKELTNSLYGR